MKLTLLDIFSWLFPSLSFFVIIVMRGEIQLRSAVPKAPHPCLSLFQRNNPSGEKTDTKRIARPIKGEIRDKGTQARLSKNKRQTHCHTHTSAVASSPSSSRNPHTHRRRRQRRRGGGRKQVLRRLSSSASLSSSAF